LKGGEGSVVLFPGALGDAVCLEPALAALAATGPVTLYARGAAAEVAALFPDRPRVRSLDAPEVARLFAPQADAAGDRWLEEFARIVSFTGAHVPEVVTRLDATGRATLVPFPRPPLASHAADYFLRAVSGDPTSQARAARLRAPELAEGTGAPFALVLLPGSGGRAKRAPMELYMALASRWRAAGGAVDVLLGPAEAGEAHAWRDLGRVCEPATIAELAAHLARAAAFAGNDSGPSHVAAALGRPGAVLFTSTADADFGPRGSGVLAVPCDQDRSAALEAAWASLRPHCLDITHEPH